jgi:hypothetical protein
MRRATKRKGRQIAVRLYPTARRAALVATSRTPRLRAGLVEGARRTKLPQLVRNARSSAPKTLNEQVNHLARDLVIDDRIDDAIIVLRSFLAGEPQAHRSRFLLGVALLGVGEHDEARELIDATYRATTRVRDDLADFPGYYGWIGAAEGRDPSWVWPRYMRLKSIDRIPATSPAALRNIVDRSDAPHLLRVDLRTTDRPFSADLLASPRMRVTAFCATAGAEFQLRVGYSFNDQKTVTNIGAAGGQRLAEAFASEVARADIDDVCIVDLAAPEDLARGLVGSVLDEAPNADVLRIDCAELSLSARCDLLEDLTARGFRRQISGNHLIAVSEDAVRRRRTHAWTTTDIDFRPSAKQDWITRPPVDLAGRVRDVLIENQVRFFIAPTDDTHVTRFSIGNPDKFYALSRILEIAVEPYRIHVEKLPSVSDRSPLVRCVLVDDETIFRTSQIELDCWTRRSDHVRTANTNRYVTRISDADLERTMFAYNPPFLAKDRDKPLTMEERLDLPPTVLDDFEHPIDIVYTWVDGGDPSWLERKNQTLRSHGMANETIEASRDRFENRDELRYSMRSIASFLPEFRHIYLVTDDQVPTWLDQLDPQVSVVSHRDVFGTRGQLPTFNSNAIETQLAHIDDLSEHFVYFNDDVLLLGPTTPRLFFFPSGIGKTFLEPGLTQYGRSSARYHNSKNAVLNAQAAFAEVCGKSFHQYHLHTPFGIRRSVLLEASRRFEIWFDQTSASQFRSQDDIAPISCLYQWYALEFGYSVPCEIDSTFINLGRADLAEVLDALELTPDAVLCLNDATSETLTRHAQTKLVKETLERLYPAAAPWESDR